MTYQDRLTKALAELDEARALLREELRTYPTPVSGCDAQYNYLIGLSETVRDAAQTLRTPRFVATPRTPEPLAGIESR